MVFKFINITKEYLNYIDNLLKYNLKQYNYKKNSGTSFYKYECMNKIIDIFNNNNIDFLELNKQQIKIIMNLSKIKSSDVVY